MFGKFYIFLAKHQYRLQDSDLPFEMSTPARVFHKDTEGIDVVP